MELEFQHVTNRSHGAAQFGTLFVSVHNGSSKTVRDVEVRIFLNGGSFSCRSPRIKEHDAHLYSAFINPKMAPRIAELPLRDFEAVDITTRLSVADQAPQLFLFRMIKDGRIFEQQPNRLTTG